MLRRVGRRVVCVLFNGLYTLVGGDLMRLSRVFTLRLPALFILGFILIQLFIAGRQARALRRPLDAKWARGRFPDVDIHLRHPEWQEINFIGEEGGGAVDELAELGNGFHEVTGSEISDPLGRFLASLGLEFHLQDRIGESLHILGRQLGERVVDSDVHSAPIVAGPSPAQIVLPDHRQLRIQRDSNSGISRQLERCPVVECPRDRDQFPGDDPVLDFARQLLPLGDLGFALLALLPVLLKDTVHRHLPREKGVHMLLLHRKARLDRFLPGPVLAVRLPLDEDLIVLHTTVPS